MSERKNIDKLFQEKFKDFEMDPPENTWPELQRRLKEKKDRKIIPIWWWRLGGIAAALLIGFLIGNQVGWFGQENGIGNQVVHEDTNGNGNNGASGNGNGQNPADEAIVDNGSDSTTTQENPMVEAPNNNSSGDKNANAPQNANERKDHFNKMPKSTGGENAVATTPKHQQSEGKRSKRNVGVENDRNRLESTVATTDKKQKTVRNQNPNAAIETSVADNQLRSLKKPKRNTESTENKKPTNAELGLAPYQSNSVVETTNDVLRDYKANTDKNKTDNKSSQAATINQKAELNLNTTNNINPVAAAEDKNQKKLDSTATAMTVPNALEELLNEKENKVTKEPKLNRWQLTSTVAPIYFGSTSGGSPIDSTFANHSKDYNTQVSYGLGVHYAINKKFAIRTGVNKVSLSYDTNDVSLYAGLDGGGLGNVDMPAGNETLNFARAIHASRNNTASRTTAAMAVGDLSTDKFSGSINQKMGYIEVPLELSYTVVDRKLGVNVIAGLSTLFLDDNQIKLTAEGLTTDLGEANNLNKTHFSSNIGLGLKYRFLKSFEANFEPIFKYQINTFSRNSGEFKPYFFGLYTGVSFRF